MRHGGIVRRPLHEEAARPGAARKARLNRTRIQSCPQITQIDADAEENIFLSAFIRVISGQNAFTVKPRQTTFLTLSNLDHDHSPRHARSGIKSGPPGAFGASGARKLVEIRGPTPLHSAANQGIHFVHSTPKWIFLPLLRLFAKNNSKCLSTNNLRSKKAFPVKANQGKSRYFYYGRIQPPPPLPCRATAKRRRNHSTTPSLHSPNSRFFSI